MKRKIFLITIIVALFFVLPFIINYFLTFGINGWQPIRTVVGYGDWLTFWGAYFAFGGTVFLGYIAYSQNKKSIEISKTMEVLTKEANKTQLDLLKIEKDRKMPFITTDLKKKIRIEFLVKSLYSEMIALNTLGFRVSSGKGKWCLAKIEFRVRNETGNLIKNVELKRLTARFIGSEINGDFVEYTPIVNTGMVIHTLKDVSILLGVDKLNEKYNDFVKTTDCTTYTTISTNQYL
ncbi:MAG: hypothetical protein QM730_02355 [Anaerolineales bacterium]